MDNNTPTTGTDLCYPVLTPIKFKGNIVKPPAFVQMSADEAAPYLAEQLIGVDAALLPEHDLAFIEAQRIEDEHLEAEAAAVDVKTTTPDTTQPTEANPAAGVPAAGKATKPTPGKK